MQTTSLYKTAEELGIEQWEHDGLVALIGPLSRGELAYEQRIWCGTACCIGGHIALMAGRNQSYVLSYENTKKLIANLYWGGTDSYRATHQQGACAIVNFLTLGDPKWDDVMRV